MPAARRAVYPTDLNQRGDLGRKASQLELALKKNRLSRGVSRKQAEPAVRYILYLAPEAQRSFLALNRSQLATLELSVDRITRMASFNQRFYAHLIPRRTPGFPVHL